MYSASDARKDVHKFSSAFWSFVLAGVLDEVENAATYGANQVTIEAPDEEDYDRVKTELEKLGYVVKFLDATLPERYFIISW